MNTISPKEFALSQIAPYYKDRNTCGFNGETLNCEYLTKENKSCVAGKNMTKKAIEQFKDSNDSIDSIISAKGENFVFKPKSRNILTRAQWQLLQNVHDRIALGSNVQSSIDNLNLFTLEELQEYSLKLKK